MKQSKLFIPTTKEITKQAVAKSHIFGLRAGFMHQHSAGLYTYLPLANMIIENISKIIDEELQKIDCNKITMPLLEPAELWQQSGRWQSYGNELFRVSDCHEREYALAPTHEEVVTDLVKNSLKSYKNYPLNLYQINTKMRDEQRPRYGFLRAREFIMMDAYSFHTDESDLNLGYQEYHQAYQNIFDRIGLDYRIVEADNGAMGGKKSHEFMAIAEIGEDTIVYDENEHAYNIEIAPIKPTDTKRSESIAELEKLETPELKTVEQLSTNLDYELENICKAVVFETEQKNLVIVFTSAEREVNEFKVAQYIEDYELIPASSELIEKHGLVEGFIGPVNLDNEDITVLYDQSLFKFTAALCGGNEKDLHYTNFNFERDLNGVQLHDLTLIKQGEVIDGCTSGCKFTRGIEIGHIFALGERYTKALDVKFLDENQKQQTPLMGCYGIGVSRLLSAIIEQNNDDNGIILPQSISPFDVHILALDYDRDELQRNFSDEVTQELERLGLKVLIDDRKERAGSKFKDADLIGIPHQIIIGKKYTEGIVEVKCRDNSEKKEMSVDRLYQKVSEGKYVC